MPSIQLYGPTCVYVSSNDEVFIADCNNHRIRKLNNQKIRTIAGNGQLGFSGDGGLAIDASLNYPNGIFVKDEIVYIADYHNHRIRKVSTSGIIETIAGNGEVGFSGDQGLAIHAQLNYPTSVFVSENNEVYIADYLNQRIRKISQNGIIETIAGNGKTGYSGDGGLAINAELNCPMQIFVANEEVYITDSANSVIRKVSKSGIIETIVGTGQQGFSGDYGLASQAQINCPMSVFVSSKGEIYITDSNNFRIRKVQANGIIMTIAGNGQDGYEGDGGFATSAQLSYPMGVFVSSKEEVYIADSSNNSIRKISQNGIIETIAGEGPYQQGHSGDE